MFWQIDRIIVNPLFLTFSRIPKLNTKPKLAQVKRLSTEENAASDFCIPELSMKFTMWNVDTIPKNYGVGLKLHEVGEDSSDFRVKELDSV